MDNTTIIDAAEKLRKCADELAEIAKSLAELTCVQPLRCKVALPVAKDKTDDGKTIVEDLATIPHLFVGGASGQRKSHFMHSFLCGLIASRSPDEVQFIIADSKYGEYSQYAGIPHLVVPVITDNRKVVFALHWAVSEMNKRLMMLARARVRNIADFNSRTPTPDIENVETESLPKTIPYIVIVIDDFADAMERVGDEIEPDVSRLAAKSRAVGIHLVLVTRHPDAKVLPDTIKLNVPGRIAFKTARGDDSEIILGEIGAERLVGEGDCFFRGKDGLLRRAQALEISDAEIDTIVAEAKAKYADWSACKKPFVVRKKKNDVQEEIADDDFQRALECIRTTRRASIAHFQRWLGYGYKHAAELMDRLEHEGYVEPPHGSRPRKINWEKLK